jgi:hypothetical protein
MESTGEESAFAEEPWSERRSDEEDAEGVLGNTVSWNRLDMVD